MIPQETKRRKPTTEEQFDRVILNYLLGKENKQIAETIDLDLNTCRRICWAYEITKSRNWEDAMQYVKNGYAIKYLEWAGKKIGIEIPQEIKDANTMKNLEQNSKVKMISQNPVVEPVAVKNEDIYLCKILEALAKQNELIEQLMDVVIPKYVVDLKDNLNVNVDLVTQRLQTCDEKLEKVVYNTRKRGA